MNTNINIGNKRNVLITIQWVNGLYKVYPRYKRWHIRKWYYT